MSNSTCTIAGCVRAHNARGWCLMHYKRWQKYGDPHGSAPRADPTCTIHGCDRSKIARGWCSMHYHRWQRYVDPNHITIRDGNVCTIDGCDKRSIARSWCSAHYMLWKRYGDANHRLPGQIRDGCKVCPWCKEDKPLKAYTTGNPYCRPCVATRKREQPLPAILRRSSVFCTHCGEKFSPAKRTDICCSVDCANARNARFMREDTLKYRALRKSAYVESVDPATVLMRDKWICQLCGDPIDPLAKFPARLSPSIDHIQPLHHGGLHEYENCQAAHLSCNASKGARID